jgi:drug/metabolite transporter (DMT)-like permease
MDFKHSDNLFNLNVRNIIVTLQGLIYTLSNFYLSLPIVSTINSTGPIFVFILDYYINGTTIGRSQFYGIIIGMIGVIFTVNGGLMLSYLD